MNDLPLRRGWTTGTCAAAAAKAAYSALLTGEFPDPVEVTLPKGQRPSFALALTRRDEASATAGIVKDAQFKNMTEEQLTQLSARYREIAEQSRQ